MTVGLAVELWNTDAKTKTATGKIVRAEEHLAEALLDTEVSDLNPDGYAIHLRRLPSASGILAACEKEYEQGHYQAAREEAERGIEKHPNHAALRGCLARACWKLHAYTCALKSFNQARLLEPNDRTLLRDSSTAMLEAGNYAQLISLIDSHEEAPELKLLLGHAYELSAYLDEARGSLALSCRRIPPAAFLTCD